MTDQKTPSKLETWAIVEVMGHSKYAGFIQEVPLGGAAMIRIDVPEVPETTRKEQRWDGDVGYQTVDVPVAALPAFTKFLGVSSIFSITPCSEEVAREAVRQFRSAPVTLLQMPERARAPRMLVEHDTGDTELTHEDEDDDSNE